MYTTRPESIIAKPSALRAWHKGDGAFAYVHLRPRMGGAAEYSRVCVEEFDNEDGAAYVTDDQFGGWIREEELLVPAEQTVWWVGGEREAPGA